MSIGRNAVRRILSAGGRFSARSAKLGLALAAGSAVLSYSGAALAYVGPGAGITMLGALWAVLAAVLLAVGGLLIWPVRALIRRSRRTAEPGPTARHDHASAD